ncbi:MAG: HipA domain-containing protein [Bifidobacteriaceae bacterium]|jgi:hypothetical protein|nr:HipA domain-containing protein [Bifidobacteriaceae bacterium]
MTHIHVYLSDPASRNTRAATIHTGTRRSRLSTVFTYDSTYLASRDAYPIDPALPLMPGAWPSPSTLPRAVLDAAPDRWGQMLIAKREAAAARQAGRTPRPMDDHLRNLGFLRSKGGWSPAPAFDLNPDPSTPAARVTSLAGAVGGQNTAAALVAHAGVFGLSAAQAHTEATGVADAAGTWRDCDERAGLGRSAQERFAPVFAAGIDALRRI